MRLNLQPDQTNRDSTVDTVVPRKASQAEIESWIDANVNSLADVRHVLKVLFRYVYRGSQKE